ncbi:MAG: hypothetical protein VCA55_00230 [Verrucomicrobiales bacterium]|jgi:hypothetical protein
MPAYPVILKDPAPIRPSHTRQNQLGLITPGLSIAMSLRLIVHVSLCMLGFIQPAGAGKMLFTDRGARIVRIANLDGSGLQTLIPSAGSNIRGIAIDIAGNDLFYADNGADIIYRARLDGSGRGAIITTGLGFPADLALDREAGKLYWCDRNNNRIERANYDGSGRETLIATTRPYYLDLDLVNKKIYWGDFSGGNIFRADLPDATDIQTVVSGLVQTRGVKLDPSGDYLYWCDRNARKIQRRRISGGLIEDLYTGLDTPHGMTLDIPAGKVYWVDTGTNNVDGSKGAMTVSRGDMDGTGPHEVVANVNQPWDITLDTRVSTYPEWVHRRFQKDAPASVSAPDADPDRDLRKNLLEYFTGLNPFTAENLQAMNYTWINGNLLFSHRQTLSLITDVIATVEVSADLQTWNSGAAFTEIHEINPGSDALSVVHMPKQEAIGSRNFFMRLKVELVEP